MTKIVINDKKGNVVDKGYFLSAHPVTNQHFSQFLKKGTEYFGIICYKSIDFRLKFAHSNRVKFKEWGRVYELTEKDSLTETL